MPHRRTPDPLLLRTQPPTEERVRRLRSLVARPGDRLAMPHAPQLADRYARVTRAARLRPPGVWW